MREKERGEVEWVLIINTNTLLNNFKRGFSQFVELALREKEKKKA